MPTATKRARRNGQGQTAEALDTSPAAGPREAREDEWHDLEGMPGFRVLLWANFPGSLWNVITGAGFTEETRSAALHRVVLEHNGWCDTEGTPYPAADAPDFYEKISNRLLRRLMRTIMGAVTALPDFPTPTRRT